MAWTDLLSALGLMLIIEGLLPWASPQRWRKMMQQIGETTDNNLRAIGAVSMLAGMLILYFARS